MDSPVTDARPRVWGWWGTRWPRHTARRAACPGWTPGDIGQHEAGEQPVINDGSKVFSQKLDHTTSDFSSSERISRVSRWQWEDAPRPHLPPLSCSRNPEDEADPILELHVDQDQRRRLHSPPQTASSWPALTRESPLGPSLHNHFSQEPQNAWLWKMKQK